MRASSYDTLVQRLAVEFDYLVTRQPRLGRCGLCGRVFVPLRPSRPEVHCRANLWTWKGGALSLVERCVPLDRETERNRKERRLRKRYERARERSGNAARETKAALRAWSDFKRDNPTARDRGRQPRPKVLYEPDASNVAHENTTHSRKGDNQ